MGQRIPDEIRDKIRRTRREGLSYRAIGVRFGYNHMTVREICMETPTSTVKPEPVTTTKAATPKK